MAPERNGRGTLARAAYLTLLIWGIGAGSPFLIPLSIAMLLAFLMAPIVKLLERARVPEGLAIPITLILFVAPVPSVVYLLVLQIEGLIQDLPRIIAALSGWLNQLEAGTLGKQLHLSNTLDPARLMERLSTSASDVLRIAMGSLARIADATSQIVLIFTLAVLMVGSRRHLRRCVERILGMSSLSRPSEVLDQSTSLIERFLLARFAIVIIVATVDSIALGVAGIPYNVLLGSFVGLMTLLPAVGFILGAIPSVIVSFAIGNGWLKTLLMFLPLAGMSIAETYFFTPKWVGNRLNISSLASFVGILAGGLLWGIPGMLLSIPILGILRVGFGAMPGLEPWGDLLAAKESDSTDALTPVDARRKEKKPPPAA